MITKLVAEIDKKNSYYYNEPVYKKKKKKIIINLKNFVFFFWGLGYLKGRALEFKKGSL